MDQTSVYTYRSDSGEVLYVGMSVSPMVRERSHRASKDMTKVATIALDWFPDWDAAAQHEKEMIKLHQPEWNRQHTQRGYEPCRSALHIESPKYDLHVQHWECIQMDHTGKMVMFSYEHCG